MKQSILLGYEVGSGAPVSVPLRNLAVTGQTQESGKTTTLEALATRAETTVLTFITKRGESSFANGHRVAPYFRDRADWQFVTSIIDATLQEKNKFLRPWIMKICRHTKTLAEVQKEVRAALVKAKGINEGVYTQLDAYLDLIVPEIQRARLAPTLDLTPGVNVMDLGSFATPMQMLFVQSALDWVNERCTHTIIVIPEAWEFIPEGKGSPVKESAITLVRKGSGIGNRIWVDSQDMAGVDKTILRGCPVWIIGVQREANEIKRNIANIPAGVARPSPADVALLERGQFFACFGAKTLKVYVRPSWMPDDEARAIATGAEQTSAPPAPPPTPPKETEDVTQEEADKLIAENATLREQVARHPAEIDAAKAQARAVAIDACALAVRSVSFTGQPVPSYVEHRSQTPSTAAASIKQPPAPRPPVEGNGSLSSSATIMLRALVASHPQALSPELWGLAAGKSPESAKAGPWYKARNVLSDGGLIEESGAGWRATVAGIIGSGRCAGEVKDEIDLWRTWRVEIAEHVGSAAIRMLTVLAAHRPYRLTNEQWVLLDGKSPASGKAGPWYAAIKIARAWGLVDGDGSVAITDKGLAVLPTLPAPVVEVGEALRVARRALLEKSQRHYDVLTRPMTRAELGETLGLSVQSMKAGPWYGAIKEMIDSKLVIDDGGKLTRAKEALAT